MLDHQLDVNVMVAVWASLPVDLDSKGHQNNDYCTLKHQINKSDWIHPTVIFAIDAMTHHIAPCARPISENCFVYIL